MKHVVLGLFAAILIALPLASSPAPVPQEQEPARATGYKRPTEEQRRAAYAKDNVVNSGRVAMAVKMTAPPAKYDATELGFVPPIVDQGNCGSCYGVATADQLTAAFCGAGHQKADGSFEINFQFGLDRCGPNFGGCNGGWGWEVAEWMMQNGWPAERYVDASGKVVNDYPPYEASPRNCREKAGAKRWKPNAIGLCSGSSSRAATVAEIKACLIQFRCTVNIAFNASSAYSNAGTNVVRVTGGANHETTLVGWDDTKNGGKGAWKTRGNWGTGLGDKGYVWMTYDSQLEDPFWMTATPIGPPPDPPGPPDPPIPPVGQLVISPASATIGPKGTQQFTSSPAADFWFAKVGEVTQTGLYTAPEAVGKYTVAAITFSPFAVASASVTVSTSPPPPIGPAIVLTQDMPKGTYIQLRSDQEIAPLGTKARLEQLEAALSNLLPPRPKAVELPPIIDKPEPPPSGSKLKAKDEAKLRYEDVRQIAENKKLLVAVAVGGGDVPEGEWLQAHEPEGFNGYRGKCLVIGRPGEPCLRFEPGASASEIRRGLSKGSWITETRDPKTGKVKKL